DVRKVIEGQFCAQLEARGQPAIRTYEHLGLAQMKADREAAASRFRELGAGAVLIVRLANQASAARETRMSTRYTPVATGGAGDWFGSYEIAFMDMGTTYSTVTTYVFLENSLFDLASGKRTWVGVTKTILKDDTDRLAEVKPLVSLVVEGMVKDGVVP